MDKMLPSNGSGTGPGGRCLVCFLFTMYRLTTVIVITKTIKGAMIARGSLTERAMVSRRQTPIEEKQ